MVRSSGSDFWSFIFYLAGNKGFMLKLLCILKLYWYDILFGEVFSVNKQSSLKGNHHFSYHWILPIIVVAFIILLIVILSLRG